MSSQPSLEGAKKDPRKEEDRSPSQQTAEKRSPDNTKEPTEKRKPKGTEKNPAPSPKKPGEGLTFLQVLTILLSLLLFFRDDTAVGKKAALERSSLSELMRQIDGNKISEVFLMPEGDRTFRVEATPYLDRDNPKVYLLPEFNLEELSKKCVEKGVNFTTAAPRYVWISSIKEFVTPFLWYGIFILGMVFLFRGKIEGLSGRRFAPETSSLRFADVGGATEAKTALMNLVAFLKDPEKYSRLGARPPRGLLLIGPPGNGKTLLAKAVAGEAAVPFYQVVGSEFVQMYVGLGAKRVRELFKTVRRTGGILFIDELDALLRARGSMGSSGGAAEYEQTLNQVLTEMDGFTSSEAVIVIGATNRPEILDSAATRPGRFDRKILVEKPTAESRLQILQATVRRMEVKAAPDLDLPSLAQATRQFSGADLAELVNLATERATHKGKNAVEMHDFEDALDKMLEGQEGTTIIFDRLKRSTSKHEAGHAVCAWLFDRDYQVRSVSVLKNSTSLGRVRRAPLRDEDFYDLDRLKRELTILLAGRAGETFGESAQGTETVGVGQDFKVAYNLARQMVTEWGMGRQTGIIYLPADKSSESTVVCSDELTSRIQADIEELLKTAYENALTTISANKQFFERIVAALEQRGHLRLSDLKELEVKA